MLFEIPGKPQGLCFVALRVVVLGSEALKLFVPLGPKGLHFQKFIVPSAPSFLNPINNAHH